MVVQIKSFCRKNHKTALHTAKKTATNALLKNGYFSVLPLIDSVLRFVNGYSRQPIVLFIYLFEAHRLARAGVTAGCQHHHVSAPIDTVVKKI